MARRSNVRRSPAVKVEDLHPKLAPLVAEPREDTHMTEVNSDTDVPEKETEVDSEPEEEVESKRRKISSVCKLPPHLYMRLRVGNASTRLQKQLAIVEKWGNPELGVAFKRAILAVDEAVEALEALGEDWRPPRGTRGRPSSNVEVGGLVDIRPKFRDRYEGILEDEDLVSLEVQKVGSGFVKVVANSDGQGLVLPRGQVMVHKS